MSEKRKYNERLFLILKKKNISQRALAEGIDVTESLISKIMNGWKDRESENVRKKIVKYLKTKEKEIFD